MNYLDMDAREYHKYWDECFPYLIIDEDVGSVCDEGVWAPIRDDAPESAKKAYEIIKKVDEEADRLLARVDFF